MRHIFWVRWVRDAAKLWWRHQIETFSALLALCEGNSPDTTMAPRRPAQVSLGVWTYSMRGDVTMLRRLSSAEPILKMTSVCLMRLYHNVSQSLTSAEVSTAIGFSWQYIPSFLMFLLWTKRPKCMPTMFAILPPVTTKIFLYDLSIGVVLAVSAISMVHIAANPIIAL